MSDAGDAGAVKFPPPLIFLGLLFAGFAADRWLQLPPWPMPWWIGGLVTVAGVALIAATLGTFRQADEDPKPWTATGQVIDTGLYARSRNPMYLGMAITMLGLALAFGGVMATLFVPVACAVMTSTVIAREEAYLAAKFGAPYRDY